MLQHPDTGIIESERLNLVLMSAEFMQASVDGRLAEAQAELGALLPSTWPDEHSRAVIARRTEQVRRTPEDAPWLLRAMVRRDKAEMIGVINFHGQPNEHGQAELGYMVVEGERRRGYATEAIGAMIGWARKQHGVRRFLLSIAPTNQASLGVAAKLGFEQIGTQIDEIDGEEYVFELKLP